MRAATDWPSYLVDRAIAPAPADCFIVERSTPVVAFGNPISAQVATLGINPSCNEFLNRRGELLVGAERRLTTWESLGIQDQKSLSEDHGRLILDGCAEYFDVRAYGWFKPLNLILAKSIGATYGRTACHLDLVQWATKPAWRDLDVETRSKLLVDGVEFLSRQLSTENYRLILVNGRTALDAVADAGIVSWQPTGVTLRDPTTTLFIGNGEGQRFLGWSCNLQSQPGARRHIGALIDFVSDQAAFSLTPNAAVTDGARL